MFRPMRRYEVPSPIVRNRSELNVPRSRKSSGIANTSATAPKPMATVFTITEGLMLNEYNTSVLANVMPAQ